MKPGRARRGSLVSACAAALWLLAPAHSAEHGSAPPSSTATAEVVQVQGDIRVDAAPASLQTGARIQEGARLQVPPDGYLRLRLADGSEIAILAGADVRLRRLRGPRPAAPAETVIELRQGRLRSDVRPQPQGRRFEVQAPGVVASVRGTRFDMAVDATGRTRTAVTEGAVLLQPTSGNQAATLLQAGDSAVLPAGSQDRAP